MRRFKLVTIELWLHLHCHFFNYCTHVHKALSNKAKSLLKFAELEIRSVCMETGKLFVWLCQSMLTQCLNRCLGSVIILQPILHMSTEEACEDRLFAALWLMANFNSSMHLLLTKKWHKYVTRFRDSLTFWPEWNTWHGMKPLSTSYQEWTVYVRWVVYWAVYVILFLLSFAALLSLYLITCSTCTCWWVEICMHYAWFAMVSVLVLLAMFWLVPQAVNHSLLW